MNTINKLKKWYRIKVLKRVTVLDILEYVDEHRTTGLCNSITCACLYYNIDCGLFSHTAYFKIKCKEFNINRALKFGASASTWWWEEGNWITGREDFLYYLIDYYTNHEPIYLKVL